MHDNNDEDKLRRLVISAFKEVEEKTITPSYRNTIYAARHRLVDKQERKSIWKPIFAIGLFATGLTIFLLTVWLSNPVNQTAPPRSRGHAVSISSSFWDVPSDVLLRTSETSFTSDFMLIGIESELYKKLPDFGSNYL